MSVNEVLDAVRALSPEEQAQVRALLDSLQGAPAPLMTEDEFARHLAAKGVVTLPEPMTEEDIAEEDEWEPIEVQGTPLSQMIIEERR